MRCRYPLRTGRGGWIQLIKKNGKWKEPAGQPA
jgi:hypothetical protein